MKNRKILFVIVEGPSDETALGVLFNRIFDKNAVHVHVVHSDITTTSGVTPANIISKVGDIVRHYAGRTFKNYDFCHIIHITDTDGAFVPDDSVIYNATISKPFYTTDEILTCNKSGIEDRNRRKRENLHRLSSQRAIWGIPYSIYYMSCNLDHVLYDKLNTTDDEKENNAFVFARKYKDDIPAFLDFISNSTFSVMNGYTESWEYIAEGNNSLKRHTNLCLCFKDLGYHQNTE